MRLLIFNFVLSSLLLLAGQGMGQEIAADTTRGLRWPTGIRVGTDLIMLGTSAFSADFSGWEVNGDVDFGRYYLAADVGSWNREQTMVNGLYSTNGNYLRLGIDVNFLLKDPDRNMIFFGMRYGRTMYDERVTYSDSANYYGPYQVDESNLGAKAGWVELVGGLRVKIWKELWMGYTARMKLLPHATDNPSFESYEIPGYGLTFKNVYWGFNYQVFWRFPVKRRSSQ